MLELKIAIYPRVSSWASLVDVCSIGWRITDQALFKCRVNNEFQRLSLSSCTQP